jgi:glyoxalase family protein
MNNQITGLHHVTATVAEAQPDLDFWAGLLGQRLVKKTVNFDNTGVYHFYYGNEAGAPGTIMTTFPYAGMGVRVGTKGAGQITLTSLSVPGDAMGFWRDRLKSAGLTVRDEVTPFGEEALGVRDPSGLEVRLVGGASDPRAPWTAADMDASRAVRGIHGVTLTVREPALTLTVLRELMDGEVVADRPAAEATRVGIGSDAPGHVVEVVRAGEAPPAVNGLGTVHHVAFAVGDEDRQLAMREELVRRGIRVTPVMDRQYFRSIYFRDPNGVLFEVATIPPGFTADEPLAELGTSLKLPPWEEPNRAAIEAALPRVAT